MLFLQLGTSELSMKHIDKINSAGTLYQSPLFNPLDKQQEGLKCFANCKWRTARGGMIEMLQYLVMCSFRPAGVCPV